MTAAQRLGIAWEGGRLVFVQVVGTDNGSALRWTEVPASSALPSTSTLVAALDSAGIDARRATLALGGDVVVVKPVALPPVSSDTRLAILRQDGERYFLLPRPPRCYGLWAGNDDGDTWVAAANEEDVRSLVATLAEAGIVVETVTLAPALYRDAVRLLHPEGSARSSVVVRSMEGSHEVVAFEGDRLLAYHHVERDLGDLEAALAETGAPRGPVALVADEALTGSSMTIERPAHLLGALAAALADPDRVEMPDLLPSTVREARRRASTRRTAALTAATAFLLLLFLGLMAFRRDRQGDRLAEELETIQEQAEPVIAMRSDLDRISREILAHRRIVDERTNWLELLQELSLTLPEDAWLAALETREDGEVVVTGYARSAGDVLTALAASPRLGDVRFETQAARTEVAGRSVESFSLAVEWTDAPE